MEFNPQSPYVLLDDQKTGLTQFFSDPVHIITAYGLDELNAALAEIDRYQASGHYLAGYFSYDLGCLLEPSLQHLWQETGKPLLLFGVFKDRPSPAPVSCLYIAESPKLNLSPSWTLTEYTRRFNQIQNYLRAGDVYQINLTFPMYGESQSPAHEIYAGFRRAQPGRYGGVVSLGEGDIISFSPELFFKKTDLKMQMRPMKGTRPRLSDSVSDAALLQEMRAEPKSQAENLMIVDLLRNDLSRLCEAGSVKVPELFALETYPTLHQMTSQVEGELREGQRWKDIFTGLFPCGSITGAPKIRAMEIISELETQHRGAYCGAMGYIAPNGDACFNVAIRTVQKSGHKIRYDVGSGVVLDSEAEDEYRECLLKANILAAPDTGFFETFRWEPENGFVRYEAHKQRFMKAATAFGITLAERDIDHFLQPIKIPQSQEPQRVRLSYTLKAGLSLKISPLRDLDMPLKVCLSQYCLTASVQYTDHKVETRNFYEGEHQRLKTLNHVDEVIFLSDDDYIREGSFTSVYIEENGKLRTPSLSGILPSIYRAEMIESGKALEEPISLARFLSAKYIFVGNSLRGLLRAELISPERY